VMGLGKPSVAALEPSDVIVPKDFILRLGE
jgi:hypothetical protein